MQNHVGSAPIPLRRAHGEALDPVASPLERRVAAQRPRDDDYFIGHHEPGIEADAELPYDFDVVVLKPFGKFGFQARRMGYSAQIAFERLGIHPNAVVAHRYGALSNVEIQLDGKLAHLIGLKTSRRNLERHLVERVRCVRDQLAKEHVFGGVDGIDHQIEDLLALRSEFLHGTPPVLSLCTLPDDLGLLDGKPSRLEAPGRTTGRVHAPVT